MGLTAIYQVGSLGCSGCEMTPSPLFYGKYELRKRFFHHPNQKRLYYKPRCSGECGGSTPPACRITPVLQCSLQSRLPVAAVA